jgi:hypothetical protein
MSQQLMRPGVVIGHDHLEGIIVMVLVSSHQLVHKGAQRGCQHDAKNDFIARENVEKSFKK